MQIKFGIILQYIQMALSVAINLVYTALMIRVLGQNEYGIYNISLSVASYLNLFSLGFSASYIYFYTKKKKTNEVAGLNGTYLIVFFILGAVALVAGLLLSFNANIFLNNTYSQSDRELTKKLFLILSINVSISFPASLFVSYITSQERFIFLKLVNIGKTVLTPLVCLVFLYSGAGSVGLALTALIISFAVDIINILYCFIHLKMKIAFKGLEKQLLRSLFVYSFFIAINQIVEQVNWQADKAILGRIINASAVAVYGVASTIEAMYSSLSTAVSSVFAPRIHRIVEKNGPDCNKELTLLMTKIGKMQFIILGLVLSGFFFFGQYFIKVWAGNEYSEAYLITILLIIPATIPLIQNLGIEIQRAKNKHKFRSVIYLLMAFINVAISIILCIKIGLVGVTLGTVFAVLLANGLIMNIYYHKALNIDILFFWKEILKTLPAFIFPTIIGVIIVFLAGIDSISSFLKYGLLYVLVYIISIYVFGLNKEEKRIITQRIRRKKDVY